ncbi:ribokinase [Thermaerobacter sp. FW80]|uniref:ribokinase n=1 Tax=Thermaerobacter sp. FW80 TaxID=2546351 RepID=UPI00107508AF|nr:ribokinase [Thermaerobacter sp. FW80]QBS37358.1 ribokinase [Thermaerobacter sp. FW80]
MADVVVVGSLNLDLIVAVGRRPRVGETVIGKRLTRLPGGKGANQAVAAARLGCKTAMVGCLGNDEFGRMLLASLHESQVDTQHVVMLPDIETGTAVIVVDSGGENSIIVLPGANGCLGPDHVAAARDIIAAAHVLLLQLEVPQPTVFEAARIAHAGGVKVVLDPAPAPSEPLPTELLRLVYLITPNETEAARLTGLPVDDPDGVRRAAEALRRQGAERVVVKRGSAGVYYLGPEGELEIPAFPVSVIDTTAAGDAFAGGVAAAIASGRPLTEALRWGCAAGALAVTRLGAQPAMPRLEELMALLNGR